MARGKGFGKLSDFTNSAFQGFEQICQVAHRTTEISRVAPAHIPGLAVVAKQRK